MYEDKSLKTQTCNYRDPPTTRKVMRLISPIFFFVALFLFFFVCVQFGTRARACVAAAAMECGDEERLNEDRLHVFAWARAHGFFRSTSLTTLVSVPSCICAAALISQTGAGHAPATIDGSILLMISWLSVDETINCECIGMVLKFLWTVGT